MKEKRVGKAIAMERSVCGSKDLASRAMQGEMLTSSCNRGSLKSSIHATFQVVINNIKLHILRGLQPLNSDHSFVMLIMKKQEKKNEINTVGNRYQCDHSL